MASSRKKLANGIPHVELAQKYPSKDTIKPETQTGRMKSHPDQHFISQAKLANGDRGKTILKH